LPLESTFDELTGQAAFDDTRCDRMKNTMTKADIVDRIAQATGLTKVETDVVVDGFIKTVAEALSEGSRIELRDFGVFSIKKRRPRAARNPRTGEAVEIDERFVPVFKVSRKLTARVDVRLKSQGGVPDGTTTARVARNGALNGVHN
jgi:nucleoid DNA-binding protein